MDFHCLARKELQALCKKNKIPANMTNVAMADALKALEKVEGLDELVNAQQSPERNTNGEPRPACRSSIRRKPINVEPESPQHLTRTRRTTRRTFAEESEQENKNVNLPESSAVPSTWRRATAASACRKIDTQLIEIGEDEKPAIQETRDVPETPAVRSSRSKAPAFSTRRKFVTQKDDKSAQRVYSTRRSVRLLEKSMGELSLNEKREVQPAKIEGLCEEIEQAKDLSDESLENESEKNEIQEGSKNIDHEMDGLEAVSCRNLDQLLENESETKHELNEDKRDDCEVDSGDLCQNMDKLLGSESETKLPEDSKENDAKLENGHETCIHSCHLSGLDAGDDDGSSDKSCFKVETSDKAINMKTNDEKEVPGSEIVISESSEMSNAVLEPETEKESNANQYSLVAENSDVTETEQILTVNVPDEGSIKVVDTLTDKVTEVLDESSEMNLMEDEQHDSHDLNLKDAIEENGGQDIESSDGNGSDNNEQIAKVESRNEPESPADNYPADKYNIYDINVTHAQNSDVIAHDCHTSSDPDKTPGSVQQKPPSCPPFSDSEVTSKISSIEDHVFPAEDFSDSAGIGIQTLDKTPTSFNRTIPYQRPSCEDKVSCGMVSLPFATNTIGGQFPRPTVARKSSIKGQTTIQKIILEDINKENFDASGRKVEPKKDKVKKTVSEEDKILYDMSLRQLTKALREKLQIKNNEARNVTKVVTTPALQILPENCAADAEPEHKN